MRIAEPGHTMGASLWSATAPPAPPTSPLSESVATDVAIVGGGYTGLSTALHLAERGVKACILEAAEVGWGASGRNGGQVNPTLKHDPDEIEALLGPQRGRALNEAIHESADDVFRLIERHQIDCDSSRKGWLQLAHSPSAVAGLHHRAEQWRKRGVATQALGPADVAGRVGSDAFAGGWLDPRAGGLHPLSYVRGLARAALASGTRIHSHTRVSSLKRVGGRWVLRTSNGPLVHADRVVLATDGYTDGLWPGLRQAVLAANSFIVVTQPLAGPDADSILPGGETAATSQRLLLYFRRVANGRLLMGGRGHFSDPTDPADFEHLTRSVRLLFPQLRELRFEYSWAGRVAITRDFLPHVHEPEPGLTVAYGYNGRGVATATAMGKHLAARLTGGVGFPFPITPVRPIPMHRFQRYYIAAGVAWFSLLDRISPSGG